MGPFCIVVGDVLRNCPSDVLFANRHQTVETLLLGRPDETFGVRIRIRGRVGRLHDARGRRLVAGSPADTGPIIDRFTGLTSRRRPSPFARAADPVRCD